MNYTENTRITAPYLIYISDQIGEKWNEKYNFNIY